MFLLMISEAKFRKSSSGESLNYYTEVAKINQPNVVSDRSQWSFYSSVHNLPALLNDPRKAKRESDFFTKTWGDGFIDKSDSVVPNYTLPNINRSHFESYLARTAKVNIIRIINLIFCVFFNAKLKLKNLFQLKRHKKHLRRSAQLAARNEPSKQAAVVSSLTNLQISISSLGKFYSLLYVEFLLFLNISWLPHIRENGKK